MIKLTKSALLFSIATGALTAPALAQVVGAAASPNAAADPGETIIVTGTRAANRTVADSPVPVDVIGADAIANTGQTETNKILNELVPSFNFPQPAIADGSDAVRPATLRGLSPDQTLVLINGKRRHVSALININGTVGRGAAAVDLNLIPGLAIDRIEVLRDGASSQYGSDAIAGVINIQLKKASEGGRASATFGKYETTMNDVANVTGLQTTGGLPTLDPADNRVLAVNSDGERKRHDGQMYTIGANFGLPIGSGFVNFTAEYRDRNRTDRQGYDIRPNYNRASATAQPTDLRELTFNRIDFRYGDPKTEDYDFILNAGVPLNEAWELYGFGTYGHRDSLSAANFRPPNFQQGGANDRDFSAITPATTPSAANYVPLRPDGFLPSTPR